MSKGKPGGKCKRWRCVCAYDGTDYAGWQKQPNGLAVQDKIEHALEEIFGQSIRTVGAGRTDAGVHALGQVFHFDAPWPHKEESMLQAMRSKFPFGISPRELSEVEPDFHALHSANGKRYRYRVCRGWAIPQEDRFVNSLRGSAVQSGPMRIGAEAFLGVHDFAGFSANRRDGEVESTVREVTRVDILESAGNLEFVVEGGGFLYKMVRSMVGALLDVGSGKMEPDEIKSTLKSGKRTERVVSAPAKGLCLEAVFYSK